MILTGRRLFLISFAALILAGAIHGQEKGGGQGGPAAGARAGAGFGTMPQPTPPKPLIPDAKPVRSCESLVNVALPNTTIESAAVDPKNPGLCRVTAFTSHPPTEDKVTIWIGIPMSGWNGRFMGTGGGSGPAPSEQVEALLAWVEEGKGPDFLMATRRDRSGEVARSRPLCPYPLVAKYKGSGGTDDAANFECSQGF